MAIEAIRDKSWQVVDGLGLPINHALPAIDPVHALRDVNQASKRLWCLLGNAASAYGFEKGRTLDWIEREGASPFLSQVERNFLSGGSGGDRFKLQIEGMWALCWVYGMVESLDFNAPSPNSFAKMLPDLKTSQSTEEFTLAMRPRVIESVAQAQDTAYCLHWAVVQCGLKNIPTKLQVQPYVIAERRRALDWVTGKEEWYEISLDT